MKAARWSEREATKFRIAMMVHLELQIGHPVPLERCPTIALHSCDGSVEHTHQTFLLLNTVTSFGVRLSFFVGCHSFARWGRTWAKDRVDIELLRTLDLFRVSFCMALTAKKADFSRTYREINPHPFYAFFQGIFHYPIQRVNRGYLEVRTGDPESSWPFPSRFGL